MRSDYYISLFYVVTFLGALLYGAKCNEKWCLETELWLIQTRNWMHLITNEDEHQLEPSSCEKVMELMVAI